MKDHADIRKELQKDLEECLEKVDFESYDPFSKNFMTALSVGMMAMIIGDHKMDEIEEELSSAKNYMKLYQDTEKEGYMKMAKDELSHAAFLLERQKEMLAAHEKTIEQMRQKMNTGA